MGKDVHDSFTAAKDVFELACDALGRDIKSLCFTGSDDELKQTKNTQVAVLTVELALLAAARQEGLLNEPGACAGHSLGEYAAWVASGALETADALRLVAKRAECMSHADDGDMAAIIGLDDEKVKAVCTKCRENGEDVWPANYNAPGQIVISGLGSAVELACRKCNEAGARKTVTLAVSGAFHSPMMNSAREEFEEAVRAVSVHDTRIDVVANCTAEIAHDSQAVRMAMINQITSPVRWTSSVRIMIDNGIDSAIEIGPGKVLRGLVKRIDRSLSLSGIGNAADITAMQEKGN